VCLDGTRNEPETGTTNVVRTFGIVVKDPSQAVYYDAGVGTLGARSATTRIGKSWTRVAGLVFGHGIKDNIEEAYRFLMNNYEAGDRIFIFGFSRGAYTALALTGMLRTVGLLRPEAENLIPYAMKLYAKGGKRNETKAEEEEFWALRSWFDASFGNPSFPDRFERQVHFLGLWDAVKSVGWLNWRAKFQQARWPFTHKPNVRYGRHAMALDEKRRPYGEYRFDEEEVAKPGDRLREMWFVGVHSDVGGTFPDHRLADISLKWVIDEAIAADLLFDPAVYEEHISVPVGGTLPSDHSLGRIHKNQLGWALIGLGWHRRLVRKGDEIHPSVYRRIAATQNTSDPYRPSLP
jgi:uncharacterized protein (DUF2235 family)